MVKKPALAEYSQVEMHLETLRWDLSAKEVIEPQQDSRGPS